MLESVLYNRNKGKRISSFVPHLTDAAAEPQSPTNETHLDTSLANEEHLAELALA